MYLNKLMLWELWCELLDLIEMNRKLSKLFEKDILLVIMSWIMCFIVCRLNNATVKCENILKLILDSIVVQVLLPFCWRWSLHRYAYWSMNTSKYRVTYVPWKYARYGDHKFNSNSIFILIFKNRYLFKR